MRGYLLRNSFREGNKAAWQKINMKKAAGFLVSRAGRNRPLQHGQSLLQLLDEVKQTVRPMALFVLWRASCG